MAATALDRMTDSPTLRQPIAIIQRNVGFVARMIDDLEQATRVTGDPIRFGSKVPNRTPSDVIVMGEKRSDWPDYYMNTDASTTRTDYYTRVEPWRHGLKRGSNYLFMDWHVANQTEKESLAGIDPWGFPDPDKAKLNP